MPVERQWRFRVEHIVERIELIQGFTASMTFNEFQADVRTVHAVLSCFTSMGEAATRIPPEVRRRFSGVPWPSMKLMRNVVVHEYDNVDLTIVWKTINEDLPVVLGRLREILREVPPDV